MSLGGGRSFNFSDASETAGRSDCQIWLGRRFHEPAVTWFGAGVKPSAAGLVWYQSAGQDPAAAGLPLDKYWRNVEVATFRSRWNDPNALCVGIQARSHAMNHEHLDIGSFVLDVLGQRWAVDLGSDDYNLPGYFGNQRYNYYRLRAEGHNTLVINPGAGPDQEPEAKCGIRRFSTDVDWQSAVADLTPAYVRRAAKVERGLALINRHTVLVQDEIEGPKGETWWFLHTAASIKIDDDGQRALLTLRGKELEVKMKCNSPARFEVRAAAPLASSPNPSGQKSNHGINVLAIHVSASDSILLRVWLSPNDGQPPKPTRMEGPLASW
jgi:hypothetical protein